jgi:hypothetical protein
MEMVKVFLVCALLPTAYAADFSLSIGPPIAGGAGVKKVKGAEFAVRLENCADLAHSSVMGTAEGLVNGTRTSAPVAFDAGAIAGVYVVSQNWPNEGAWAVSLIATCGKAKAGAIVPIGPQGFLRESTKVLPRAATPAEINTVLETLNKH